MRIFIRDCATEKLLAPNGKWTNNTRRALTFEQTLRAWEEIDRLGLSGVQIVMRSGHIPRESAIPVAGCQAAPA